MVTKAEVLKYARAVRRDRPKVNEKELRAILRAKFVDGVDPMAAAAALGTNIGLISNPMDWIKGLLLIARVFSDN